MGALVTLHTKTGNRHLTRGRLVVAEVHVAALGNCYSSDVSKVDRALNTVVR